MSDEKYINQDLADPISKLGNTQSTASSDLYALSRRNTTQASSYSISYSDLVNRVVSDISARFGFNTMAFCDRSNFAESDHLHGYTYVRCYPVYTENTGQSCIMTLNSYDGRTTDQISVFSPSLPVQPPQREPEIGEVRFIAANSLTAEFQASSGKNTSIQTAINNGTFDGWVYPDGSEYSQKQGKYDFSRAYQVYGGRNGKFNVPVLSNFVKLNPGVYWNNATLKMPGQIGIQQHNHDILDGQSLAATISITGSITMKQAKYGGADSNHPEYLHAAKKNKKRVKSQYVQCNSQYELNNLGNATVYYDSTENDETYPSHCLVPVQIYIGRTLSK